MIEKVNNVKVKTNFQPPSGTIKINFKCPKGQNLTKTNEVNKDNRNYN